ncbi:hypothetical protein Aperf_G00000000868 [Anoplocephala perfoliata]
MDYSSRNMNLAKRQQCACLIQEIGSRVPTTQVVINSALCYMHYFYEKFSADTVKPIYTAITSLYIACKTEDYSRKLLVLLQSAYSVLRRQVPPESSQTYRRIVLTIHSLEGIMLMVIGFRRMDIKHPHVILVNIMRKNNIPKEVATCGYFVCSNILHFTTLVLRHSAEAIAAVSLYIAAKWLNFDIKSQNESWFHMFSTDLTMDEIRRMSDEFTTAFNACDHKVRDQVRDTFKFSIIRQNQHDEHMRGVKRSYEAQPQVNSQVVHHNTNAHDDGRSRVKIPRISHSPKSQPPPQVPNQPSLSSAVHPDSANAFKARSLYFNFIIIGTF